MDKEKKKILPFLEISVISTTNKYKSEEYFLKEIQEDIFRTYKIKDKIIKSNEKHNKIILRIDFSSKKQFLSSYQKEKEIYEYILENVIQGKLILDNFKAESYRKKGISEYQDLSSENYVVLKFRSNWKDPMREKYRLTTKIDHIFGVESAIEEVEDGFIKFFKRKEDYDDSRLDNLSRIDWKKWFKLKDIGLSTPFAVEFFNLLENFLNNNNNKKI